MRDRFLARGALWPGSVLFLTGPAAASLAPVKPEGDWTSPEHLESAKTLAEGVAKDDPVVRYCNGPECDRMPAPAVTSVQQGHCTEAKVGLLQFPREQKGGGN